MSGCNSSKELLQLERKTSSSTSPFESTFLVCKNGSSTSQTINKPPGKLVTGPVAKSEVLGRVKNFLGVISEANARLKKDAKDNSKNYDIEVLTGNEYTVIELDLMLGIADLHTPEAVAAAESAIAGGQPPIPLASTSTETESEETRDDETDDDDTGNCDDARKTQNSSKQKTAKLAKDDSSSELWIKNGSKKRPKIVEMS